MSDLVFIFFMMTFVICFLMGLVILFLYARIEEHTASIIKIQECLYQNADLMEATDNRVDQIEDGETQGKVWSADYWDKKRKQSDEDIQRAYKGAGITSEMLAGGPSPKWNPEMTEEENEEVWWRWKDQTPSNSQLSGDSLKVFAMRLGRK